MQHINDGLHHLCGRPLVFGDTEQIAEYKKINREAASEEERERERAAGNLKTYTVHIDIEGSCDVEVEAVDEAEAKELALEEIIDLDEYVECTAYQATEKKRST